MLSTAGSTVFMVLYVRNSGLQIISLIFNGNVQSHHQNSTDFMIGSYKFLIGKRQLD